MRNIKTIENFLPEQVFSGSSLEDLVPFEVNESISDGENLAGKTLSEVKVSDWLFDFGIERKSFPKNSSFTEFVQPEEDLSDFSGEVINRFVVEAWKSVKTKKLINASMSEKERERVKSKLRSFWTGRKKLEQYKREKETLINFLNVFEEFVVDGGFGKSLYENAGSITLTKTSVSPVAGSINKIVTNLKSFFTKPGWQKAISWLINSVANNDQYVKWLDTTVYEAKMLGGGISPDVKSAFNTFIVDCDLDVEIPDMENAMSSINMVARLAIEKSKDLPKQGAETWMGCLYNTHLFGVYQRLLVIGCCAWVYDLVGDTDIMASDMIPTPRTKEKEEDQSNRMGLEKDEVNGIQVYKISYLSGNFKEILRALLRDERIGKSKYEEYLNRIEAKKDSRSLVRSVRIDVLNWANVNGFRRSEGPEIRGLQTDGSTRIFMPVKIYNKLVG